jgi:hypothetical protein
VHDHEIAVGKRSDVNVQRGRRIETGDREIRAGQIAERINRVAFDGRTVLPDHDRLPEMVDGNLRRAAAAAVVARHLELGFPDKGH